MADEKIIFFFDLLQLLNLITATCVECIGRSFIYLFIYLLFIYLFHFYLLFIYLFHLFIYYLFIYSF